MHIGRRMRRIALESAIGGMLLSAAGMLLAAYGLLPPIGEAVAQEVIDLIAVLNAVRVALPFGVLRDFESVIFFLKVLAFVRAKRDDFLQASGAIA